jgi:hypothetical protein
MERERDFPASRKAGVESATGWILGMLGIGIIAALLVVTLLPPSGEDTNGSATSAEHVVPNTPPPVRTE